MQMWHLVDWMHIYKVCVCSLHAAFTKKHVGASQSKNAAEIRLCTVQHSIVLFLLPMLGKHRLLAGNA